MEKNFVNINISDFVETLTLVEELPGIIKQLEFCEFECQGGPLRLNTSFIRLKEILASMEGGLTPRATDGYMPPRIYVSNGVPYPTNDED